MFTGQSGNFRMTGHGRPAIFLKEEYGIFLSALRAVAAGGQLIFCRSAAAGVAKFFRGRAGIPVAGTFRYVFMGLAAGAGVQGGGLVIGLGFLCIAGRWL
jgi:hypothetical protein